MNKTLNLYLKLTPIPFIFYLHFIAVFIKMSSDLILYAAIKYYMTLQLHYYYNTALYYNYCILHIILGIAHINFCTILVLYIDTETNLH